MFRYTMTPRRWLLLATIMLVNVGQAVDDVDSEAENLSRDPYHMYDYRNHSCKRPCQKDAPPKSCKYYFLLEHFTTMAKACYDCPMNESSCHLPQCVPADGRVRGILSVNRMLPGPTIDVCVGDTVIVLLDNRMELGEGTSIHWHGLRQTGSPYMDGTNLVTQCPIHSHSKMVYRFTVVDPGTHFWHAHATIQRADGLFGGLIVRTPYETDPHRHLYDYDLSEHNILLTDWADKTAGEAFSEDMHGTDRADPVSILINGLGSTVGGPAMPYPLFRVKEGKRYRFRVAFNGIMDCPLYITVDGHSLLMIASDGHNFEPLEVDGFTILAGERYDFILQTKHKAKDNFWIRFKGHGRGFGLLQAAILRYDGARDTTPSGEATFNNTVESDNLRTLNSIENESNKSFQMIDMVPIEPNEDADVLTKKPDKQFYISIAASKLEDERFKPPSHPSLSTQQQPIVRPVNHQFNYISSQLPPSPPLSQFKDIPQEYFCNNDTVSADCSQVLCMCVHSLNFDLGDIVEFVLVSFTNTLVHPLHMHGHSFRVVTMKSFNHDLTVSQVKAMDKKGEIPRKGTHAAYKDTIAVHAQSVVIIRLRANNPGFWFFHCHIEFHSELGMTIILQAGKPNEMPKPPKNFPTCGSWRPELRETLDTMQQHQVAVIEESDGHTKTFGAVIGSAAAIVIIVLVLFGVFFKRLRKQGTVLYQRVTNTENGKYKSLL